MISLLYLFVICIFNNKLSYFIVQILKTWLLCQLKACIYRERKNIHYCQSDTLEVISMLVKLSSCLLLFNCPCLILCDPMDCSPALLSMGFPRQEYSNGLPFPFPGNLSDPGIKPEFPALAGRFFTTEPPGKPLSP